jgi:hypothetical protein
MPIDEIDWTKEPLTEHETQVRTVWLSRRLQSDPLKMLDIKFTAMTARSNGKRAHGEAYELPRDLRDAAERAEQLLSEARRQQLADEYREIEKELTASEG